jgi:hypothetical protein
MAQLGDLAEVVVIHQEPDGSTTRLQVMCLIQATTGFFEVTTAVYEGDSVEVPDPRGGIDTRYVSSVKVNNAPALGGLSHIAAKWGTPPRAAASAAPTNIYNGPVIHMSGGTAQLAWGNEDVAQSQGDAVIAPGFEDIAAFIVELLERLPELKLDEGDLQMAREESTAILTQATKPTPDRARIRRASAVLRGILAPIVLGASSGLTAGALELAKKAIEMLSNGVIPQ